MLIKYEVQFLDPDSTHNEDVWITANTDAKTRVEALKLEKEYVRNYPQTAWRIIMVEFIPLPSSVYKPPTAWEELDDFKRLAS